MRKLTLFIWKIIMNSRAKQTVTRTKHARPSQTPQVSVIVNNINNQIRILRAILPKIEERKEGRGLLKKNPLHKPY